MREIPCCFECWPGGPVTPPPCRKCGSTTDYYTSGLCARCHTHAPGARSPVWRAAGPLAPTPVVVESCPDCHTWGVTRRDGWICSGCRAWREKYRNVGACATCGQQVALDDQGSCRLCRKQRSMLARMLGRKPSSISLTEANRRGQQLFFAGMIRQQGHGPRVYRKKTVPADLSLLRPVAHQQLVLVEVPRDLAAGPAPRLPATPGPRPGGGLPPVRQ
jgi:hypothetical protein